MNPSWLVGKGSKVLFTPYVFYQGFMQHHLHDRKMNQDKADNESGDEISREELIGSFSRHAKLSNKYMLGMLFCSIVFAMNLSPSEKVKLPFIGEVDVEYYHMIEIALISCFMILFSSAYVMSLRIREYYSLHYFKRNDKDYFDLIVEPTLFRMSPIAWMIKNKGVFHINLEEGNQNWKKFELIVYFFLKTMAFSIIYLFPTLILIAVLIKSKILFFNFSTDFLLRMLLITLSLTAVTTFAIVWKNTLVFTYKLPGKIFK